MKTEFNGGTISPPSYIDIYANMKREEKGGKGKRGNKVGKKAYI
jgi:hypothetical protein